LRHCQGFSLKVVPGLLEIQVTECLKDVPVVLAMKRTAEEFVGFLTSKGEAGIQFVESAERMSGNCPICTSVLREPLVRCARCRSPHHAECWTYLGRCAVYGCEPRSGRRAA